MKLNPDKSPIADLSALLEVSNFESSLPAVATLEAAYADPSAAEVITDKSLGTDIMRTGVRAFRFVGARVGVDVGVPTHVLGAFADALSVRGSDQAATQWIKFIGTVNEAIIDIAVDAIGAIPIVGWLAKAAASLVQGIALAAAKKRPSPPIIRYDEQNDEGLARKYIERLSNLDWTSLYTPPYAPKKWNDWEIIKQNGGWLMRPEERISDLRGALPGGPLGSRAVQSRNCFDPNLRAPLGETRVPHDVADALYLRTQREATECILDTWDTTPSVARVTLSAWQQMTAKDVATVWNVDTRNIVSAWEAYCETAIEFSRAMTATSVSEHDVMRWLALKNLSRAVFVRGWKTPGADEVVTRQPRLDHVASRYITDLRTRQFAAANTKLVAYAQLEQGAFADKTLRQAMVRERAALLNSPLRWTIELDDVVDPEFRNELKRSLEGASPPQRTPPDDRGSTRAIPDATPFPVPDGTAAGGGLAAAVLGLAAAFVLLS